MSNFKNLTGMKFGKWTVIKKSKERGNCGQIKWLCRCECGTEKVVIGTTLTNGRSTSCGCSHQNKKFKDLTGKIIGEWTVLSKNGVDKNGRPRWLCRCNCGTEKTLAHNTLTKKLTKSCGCLSSKHRGKGHEKDITGMKFGKWTAIKRVENRGHHIMWLCKCECGAEKIINKYALTSGITKSCGCSIEKEKWKISLINKTFGNLTVIKEEKSVCTCSCSCGNIIKVPKLDLLYRGVRSCGCKVIKKKNYYTVHDMSNTRLYHIWRGIKTRCYNSNHADYKSYGALGIEVCEKWRENFIVFCKWSLGNGYDENLSIDRINPHGNYEPSNCRWVSFTEQLFNKR